MMQSTDIVYGTPKLDLTTKIEHLCVHGCRLTPVDENTGHVVGFWCKKIPVSNGVNYCDMCEREFIDKTKYYDPNYEMACPECVAKYDI